jgi:hypothetical protein
MDRAITQCFNSDLLANEGDLECAQRLYPSIVHVLDFPELRELFNIYDVPANAAKKRSFRAGICAVGLGAVALWAPVIGHVYPAMQTALAIGAAVCAVGSVVIGLAGLLLFRAKNEWLYRRLLTERLRQFHFQTFICRLPQILASVNGEAAIDNYRQQRNIWLAQFKSRFDGKLGAELGTILLDDEERDIWLHQPPPAELSIEPNTTVSQVFEAYRALRIMRQLQYATEKLGRSDSIIPRLPRSQAALFSNTSLLCIAAIVIIHIVIAVGYFTEGLEALSICVVVLVLGVRTLEEGLKPDRELERYQHYRSAIRAIRDRFDLSQTPEQKLDVMKEMERLSYDEMCDFIRTHSNSRFVM